VRGGREGRKKRGREVGEGEEERGQGEEEGGGGGGEVLKEGGKEGEGGHRGRVLFSALPSQPQQPPNLPQRTGWPREDGRLQTENHCLPSLPPSLPLSLPGLSSPTHPTERMVIWALRREVPSRSSRTIPLHSVEMTGPKSSFTLYEAFTVTRGGSPS